jgi:hypothetical protein
MSRHLVARRSVIVLVALYAGLLLVPAGRAQSSKPGKGSVQDFLGMEIETKDYAQPMPLKQFLQELFQAGEAKNLHVPLAVNVNAFKETDEPQPNGPYDDEVKLPVVPRRMTAAQALQLVVGQLKVGNGAFFVRRGAIVITTQNDAGLAARLQEPVIVRFDKTPLADVVRQLSDLTGAAILIDPRLQKREMQTPITAELNGNVSLAAVLPIIADMAEVRFVRMSVATNRRQRPREAAAAALLARCQGDVLDPDNPDRGIDECLYVTTPTNAEALEKRLRERMPPNLQGIGGGLMGVPGAGIMGIGGGGQLGFGGGVGGAGFAGGLGGAGIGGGFGIGGIGAQPGTGSNPNGPDVGQLQAEIAALRAELARLRQGKTEAKKEAK